MRTSILVPLVASLLAATFAGCSGGGGGGDGPQGTLVLGIMDDPPTPVRFDLAGAYARLAGNGSWETVAGGAVWELTGTGDARILEGDVPAGTYERFRILFDNVTVAGERAYLAKTGLELPVPFTVPEGGRVQILLNLSWDDAVFPSREGTTFTPAVGAIEVTGPGGIVRIEAEDLGGGGTLPPVARMRVFDGKGLQAFVSDFVADDSARRVIANAGRVTFAAGDSTTVQPNTEIVSYQWDFGDGVTAQGVTAFHDFPLRGGNVTVELTVTDSKGAVDRQSVDLALKPGTATATFPFAGSVTGADPVNCAGSPGLHEVPVVSDVAPDGSPGGVSRLQASLAPNGTAHALANIDLAVLDGGGAEVGSSSGDGVEESIDTTFDPAAPPAGGNWTVQVFPCLAFEVAYEGSLTLTWQAIGNPVFVAWLETYDDGHQHQH